MHRSPGNPENSPIFSISPGVNSPSILRQLSGNQSSVTPSIRQSSVNSPSLRRQFSVISPPAGRECSVVREIPKILRIVQHPRTVVHHFSYIVSLLRQFSVSFPSILRQCSVDSPSTLRQFSVNSASILRRSSVNSPAILRQISVNPPSILRQLCVISPSILRQLCVNSPSILRHYVDPLSLATSILLRLRHRPCILVCKCS